MPVAGHKDYLQFLAVMNIAAMKMDLQVSLNEGKKSFEYTLDISGSYANSISF